MLNLCPGCVSGFSVLKCTVSQAGKGIFSSLDTLGTLSCTGCVYNRQFSPLFFSHHCVLPTLILIFIFEAYPYRLLDFKCWCGWMTIPSGRRGTASLLCYNCGVPPAVRHRPVTSSSKSFDIASGRKLENGTGNCEYFMIKIPEPTSFTSYEKGKKTGAI